MKTILVWLRNDLRLHDHPALYAAVKDADRVVPVFVFDDTLLHGAKSSANRSRFLLECLEDLRVSLQECGADLVLRSGKPEDVLSALAKEYQATAIYYTVDYTPYARRRDDHVTTTLQGSSLTCQAFPGRLIVDSFENLRTKTDKTYKVFTPFWRTWQRAPRRKVLPAPHSISLPSGLHTDPLPALTSVVDQNRLSPNVLRGGEVRARKRLQHFLDNDVVRYHQRQNYLGQEGTSRLSAYLHFGCLSPLEIEAMLPDNEGAAAWHRQLAWRDFYQYILYYFPGNTQYAFQERYRSLTWEEDTTLLQAWQTGHTGYPVVDAAMRQLLAEGWMHNRARLIVGSFLTKDLGLNWQHGEAHFMRWLLDGDTANNNGNWQWIASVGVDPAPLFRRLYNPTAQQKTYDPDGEYVRRYIPELQNIPDDYLTEPWTMPEDIQWSSRCILGKDYPTPIVNHRLARQATLERYKSAQ